MAEDKKRTKEEEVKIVRIMSKDVLGNKTVYAGLTQIKGVNWITSNAVCKKLGIDRKKKIQELSEEEINKIEDFVSKPDIFSFLKNRRKDRDSGEDKHLNGADLDLQKEFDIKRLKKVKSYKGIRHGNKLPVRGQRTKANFRKNRKQSGSVGVKKKGAKR
jgi:small subunit ribosomal protein S13